LSSQLTQAAGRRISREVAGRRESSSKGTSMRKLISLTMAGVLAIGLGITLSGCSEESSGTKKEETITTPGGKAKVTEQTKVETSGKNPPAPQAP
jgi:hypothetical protein